MNQPNLLSQSMSIMDESSNPKKKHTFSVPGPHKELPILIIMELIANYGKHGQSNVKKNKSLIHQP